MDCSACLSCGMVVLLIMAGCMLFPSLMVLGKTDMYMCAGIWQDVVLGIPSGWCDVGGGWNVGYSWCLILYSMMILECWRRYCSVGRSGSGAWL